MYPDNLVELWCNRKVNKFSKNLSWKAVGQGLFRRNSETAERFHILSGAVYRGLDFITPYKLIEFRRKWKMRNCLKKLSVKVCSAATPKQLKCSAFCILHWKPGSWHNCVLIDFMHPDKLVDLRRDGKCLIVREILSVKVCSAVMQQWRNDAAFSSFALQSRVVTQLSWIDFMHPEGPRYDTLVESRRDRKMKNCLNKNQLRFVPP